MQWQQDNQLFYRENLRIESTGRGVVMKKSLICNHKAVDPLNCHISQESCHLIGVFYSVQ